MNLFGFRRRQTSGAPAEVIQAAYEYYGLSPDGAPDVRAERLKALSDHVWVVKINESASAVVAYNPGEEEPTTTAAWFGE